MFITPIMLAGFIAVPFLIAHFFIVNSESKGLKILLWIVISLKLLTALTMGHFDLFKFITFISYFIDNPTHNPWIFSESSVFAEFPYPPLLMYIHAFVLSLFKPFLNLNYPYWPTPYSFSLYRIPFLIVDLLFLKFFLKERKKSNFKIAFLFYLLNPFLLLSEYFMGQMNWIAVLFFFFAILEFEMRKMSIKFISLITLSIMLKPVAIIFLPLLILELVPDIFKKPTSCFKYFLLFSIPVLFWKLSEIPYVFSYEYNVNFGSGAVNRIFGSSHFLPIPLFALVYIVLGLYWSKDVLGKRCWTVSERIIVVTLIFISLGHPTLGWSLWCLPFVIKLLLEKKIRFFLIWSIWSMLFVIKYFVHDSGPFFYSFGMFFTYFLQFDFSFPVGMPSLFLKQIFGVQTTEIIQNSVGALLRLTGLLLVLLILIEKQFVKIKGWLISFKIILILLLSGCSFTSKKSCENKYDFELKYYAETLKNKEEFSVNCCIKNPESLHPYCIPMNRDVIVPPVHLNEFKDREIEYEIIDKKNGKSRKFKFDD